VAGWDIGMPHLLQGPHFYALPDYNPQTVYFLKNESKMKQEKPARALKIYWENVGWTQLRSLQRSPGSPSWCSGLAASVFGTSGTASLGKS